MSQVAGNIKSVRPTQCSSEEGVIGREEGCEVRESDKEGETV